VHLLLCTMPKASKTMTAMKVRLKSIKKKARMDPSSTLKGPKISKNVEDVQPISIQKGKNKAEPPIQKSQSTLTDDPPLLPSMFIVVAGSYEKLLYGLQGTVSLTDSPSSSSSPFTFDLKPIFIFPAHVSCIKAVAASPAGGKWLATGSADEIIKVWDLRRRKEIGGLMHHEGLVISPPFFCTILIRFYGTAGSITHLNFPSRSHLLSASEDGSLTLFHTRDWTVLRNLKGHKGRVNCVAVHPSCKLALSVGKDKTLRMWDLMRGKGSASTKLGKGAVL
jgi:protein MAK11